MWIGALREGVTERKRKKKTQAHILRRLREESQKILRAHERQERKFGLELHDVARGHSREHEWGDESRKRVAPVRLCVKAQ